MTSSVDESSSLFGDVNDAVWAVEGGVAFLARMSLRLTRLDSGSIRLTSNALNLIVNF